MTKIQKFEDILAWQKSESLCLLVYKIFDKCRDFKFRDQIQSASVSIMNNIAEGYERQSNREFARFLYIAKGSCGEVRSMVYLASKLGYINNEDFEQIMRSCIEISKMCYGLIGKLGIKSGE